MTAPLEKSSRTQPLTWAGAPLPALLRLSGPIAVSMVSYSVMTLVDTLLVGQLGPSALAGVGLAGTATFVLLCFSIGLLRAVKVLVSQAVGRGESREAPAHLGAGLFWALSLGLVSALLGQVLARLLPALAASHGSGVAASTYLQIRILAAPVVLAGAALREARYGLQKSRAPMVAAVTANLFNIALGWTLIVFFHQGVAGAAVATVLAHCVETGMLAFAQRRDGFGLGRTTVAHVRAIWRLGVPVGLQFMLELGSFALLAVMVSRLGETEMAAHQIALQVIHFSFLPAVALGEAASVLAGEAVGARRLELVNRVARSALAVAAGYTGLCTLVLVFLGRQIASSFTSDQSVAATALTLLEVAALFQVFDGASIVARGVLRGTGDVRYPAVMGILTAWLCTPPLTWLLGYHFGLGAKGGWLGLCAEIFVGAVLFWARLERGGWKAVALERVQEAPAAEGQLLAQAG